MTSQFRVPLGPDCPNTSSSSVVRKSDDETVLVHGTLGIEKIILTFYNAMVLVITLQEVLRKSQMSLDIQLSTP